MNAYVLKVNGERQEAVPCQRDGVLSPKTFSLRELQDIVGGFIEVLHLTDEVFMVVDEEGKLKGNFVNMEATKMVRKCGYDDYIVGDVLVCRSDMIE